MSQLIALLRKDARVVYRDGFLAFLPFYALVLALAGRFGVPWIPVADFGLYLAPAMVLMGALLLGNVLGFALIEEREQGTWLLLRVLPVEPPMIFLYFCAVGSVLSFSVGLIVALAYGYPVADLPTFFLMTAVSSLSAPIIMLVLAVAASNKIEGMAVTKIFNIVTMVPAVVFVAPMPWQLAAAWCPWYWMYLGLLRAYTEDPGALSAAYWPNLPLWLIVTASLVLALGSIVVLARLYVRRAA